MDMRNMKNQILSIFLRVLLQFKKSTSFCRPISKNTKPLSQFCGFVVFKPKSHLIFIVRFASFWLKYSTSGVK